jgi:hypothetical protein
VCGTRQDVIAHHMTGGGMGMKAANSDTIPLCRAHHEDFHALTGRFKGWQKDRLRAWQQDLVDHTQRLLTSGAIGDDDG